MLMTGTKTHQSKHATLADALAVAKEQSLKKHGATFGVIEDRKHGAFFVEEDFGIIREFETLHGEYIQGQFIKPAD